jgi:hypothetical protein
MRKIYRIRQLKYPKEFRITPIRLHVESLKDLESLINNMMHEQKSVPVQPADKKKDKTFYAEISVGVWRLKKKMTDPKNHQPLEEMSKAYRHLESILLTLEKEGIEIQDHDGQPFDSGLSINVLAFQPTPGFHKEIVLETIKPSVYVNGERILIGEVIVGTPIT